MRRSKHRLAAALLVALLAVGCGGGDDEESSDPTSADGDSTTTSGSGSSTTASDDPAAEVEAAYLAYWEMGERLLQHPDPDDPEIARRTTGNVRDAMVDSLSTLKAQRQAVRYGDLYEHDVISVDVTSEEAEVLDCLVDDGEVIDTSTGDRVAGGLVTVLYRTTMVLEDGQWKASEAIEEETWEGSSTCDG